jgi:hypothetical protein
MARRHGEAKRQRDAARTLDRPGQKPLLQGHLRSGGVRPDDGSTPGGPPPDAAAVPNEGAEPAEDVSAAGNTDDAVRGKATKSPAATATRPHLEGSEQGPS